MKTALVGLIAVFGYIWIVCKNYNFESGLAKQSGVAGRRKVAFGALSDDKRSFAMFAAALIVAFSSFALLFADRPKQAEPAAENIALPFSTSRAVQSAPPSTTAPSSRPMQAPKPLLSRRTARPVPFASRRKIYAQRAALSTPVSEIDGPRDSSLVLAVPVAVSDSMNAPDANLAIVRGHAGLRMRLIGNASRFCRWSGRLVASRFNPRKRKASASAQDPTETAEAAPNTNAGR